MNRFQSRVLPRQAGIAALFTGLMLLCGCDTVEPRYAASRVTFDPGLVGWWQAVPKADAATDGAEPAAPPPPFEIVARKAKTENGVFAGGELDGASAVPTPGTRPTPFLEAYIVRLPKEEGAEEKPAAQAPKPDTPPDRSNELWAVMLQAGEQRLVGLQARLPKGGPFTTPYHMVMLIKRDGDKLQTWSPKHVIAWMPGVQMLDPVQSPRGPVPSLENLEKRKDGGLFLTLDADRLLEVYSHYADQPAFWEEQPATFNRVPAPVKP